MTNPLADLFDNSDLVCIMPSVPTVAYGPFTPVEAMAFLGKWNPWYAERGLAQFVAIPVTKKV